MLLNNNEKTFSMCIGLAKFFH